MKTAIFLGAGASAAEGAPMQSALFKDYFKNVSTEERKTDLYKGLQRFFKGIFGINLGGEIKWGESPIEFPTFEEALGVLDLAESRGETLRSFDSKTPNSNLNQIRMTRLYLVLAMSKVIAEGLEGKSQTERPHRILKANLESKKLLKKTIFISTNYDILIDIALTASGADAEKLNYGVEYVNTHNAMAGPVVLPDAVPLFKIHGSLNWLYCPTCNVLNVSKSKKSVLGLLDSVGGGNFYKTYARLTQCGFCRSILTPVIVPPTFYKDMSNVFLRTVWNKAENALRDVGHIIFCGYSFPDADMHIKYLLKRAQTNRDKSQTLRFTVINNPPPKYFKTKKEKEQNKVRKEQEKARYERFLGKVTYDMKNTFQYFAANPQEFF